MLCCLSAASLFCALNSCDSINDFSDNPDYRLSFSVDTLSFDTIFSSIGSTTKHFMVYNTNDEALRIEKIELANPSKSGFRINMDGRKGVQFSDIDIWKKDSLYVAVEVTVDPHGDNQPLVVEDSVLFYLNGIRYSVLLQAYGQDVHLFRGGYTIVHDTTLTADIPYLIYDSLKVDEGATLTVEKGAILYMHDKAGLVINGTIKAQGTQDEPVMIRGDRLDYIELDVNLPYDRVPGQWDGIRFGAESFDNEFNYVIVRNGVTGLNFCTSTPDRSKIIIRNSQITNMNNNLLVAVNCLIEASGSEFTNASDSTVALIGGKYKFTHCTIANYKRIGNRNEAPCLVLSDRWRDGDNETLYALQEADFENCIIDGSHSPDSTKLYGGEILFDTDEQKNSGDDATFNYRFNSCFLKTARLDNERFTNCLFIKSPTYLKIGVEDDEYAFDFRLKNESAGIGQADRAVAEQYPVDRYGVSRLNTAEGVSIGAYQYVYQEEETKN